MTESIGIASCETTPNVTPPDDVDGEDFSVCTSHLQPEPLMIIPVQVGDAQVMALVDTGASLSLVQEGVTPTPSYVNGGNKVIQGIGSSRIISRYVVTTSMQVGTLSLDVNLHVVDAGSLKHQIILGTDFLVDNELTVDFANRRLSGTFPKGLFEVYFLEQGAWTNNWLQLEQTNN
jgi:hypothetical protein